MSQFLVAALYKFVSISDADVLRNLILEVCRTNGVNGTILLASEGINGTIAGDRNGTDLLLAWLRSDPRFANIETKESYEQDMPFYRTKVKLKKEIVANNELLVTMLGLMVGLSKKRTEEAKKALEETKKETEDIKVVTNDLIVQKDKMEAFLEKTRLGKIIAQKEAFPGVTIKIIDQEQVIKSRYAEGTFLLFEGAMSHNASVK